MKMCELDPNKVCDDCGECDKYCIYDSSKLCDNCFMCLESEEDYAEIKITDVILDETDQSSLK